MTRAEEWFASRGWTPFAFQREVWQAIAEGRSGLLHATTGAGKTYAVGTRRISLLAPETHGKDAKIIGGGTGAGALVGAIADGKSGAAKGALVGGGAGTGVVLATRGKEVSIPAGSRWRVRLARPLVVD